MSRYIDKDLLLKQINAFISTDEKYTDYNCGYDDCICAVQDTIEDMPEADVVEVTRCKDCKYWQDNNGGYPHPECRWGRGETPDGDDFCSAGERK